jgi:hypothetical protein
MITAGRKKTWDEPLHHCSLAQDLLDAGDRLVDGLFGADALGRDAMYGTAPDVLVPDRAQLPFMVPYVHV